MASVRATRVATVHGRRVQLKPSPSPVIAGATAPAAQVFKAVVRATAVQLRVMAEEARELIVGRLYASPAQRPGLVLLATPRVLRLPGMQAVPRQARRYWPLRRATVLRKLRAQPPQDGRFLIATGDYLDGIEVFKGKLPGGAPYYMVRLKKRMHFIAPDATTTKPITLTTLARIHEFGSHRHAIAPRPHWRPAVADVVQRIKRLRKTIKAEALRESFRRIA